jgi:hypothetical protein
MVYALSWFIVVVLIALWSVSAWAMHGIAVWTVSNAGALSGAASGVGAVQWPEWLGPWVPPEVTQWLTTWLSGLGPMVASVLESAPSLVGVLTTASWVVWGLGTAFLVALGVGLHLLIALWRRQARRARPVAGTSLVAG